MTSIPNAPSLVSTCGPPKLTGEKYPQSEVTVVSSPSTPTLSAQRHKSFRDGCHRLLSLHQASHQLWILAFIFLCGPGVFAGITGLGGAGLGNPVPVNNSLIANYATSAVVSFFAGPMCTRLGFRLALMLGSAAFTFYSVCLLIYKQTQDGWVLILGGIILGVLSSFEWTARGAMVMAYPLQKEKGKHVSFNLTLFNFGAILASLVCFTRLSIRTFE